MIKELWHGSPSIIEEPIFGQGRPYNDYGLGFYCTEDVELAKEWACTEERSGYANHYALDTDGLKILNLSDGYTILHWLALLVENRKFSLTTEVGLAGKSYLKEHFLLDISDYDVITGYRADDSYFSFARGFLNNAFSLAKLSKVMRFGKLGEQFVLKSRTAFDRIQFLGYEEADNAIYYRLRKRRDELARRAYLETVKITDLEGVFMRDVIREEMTADDPRLQ